MEYKCKICNKIFESNKSSTIAAEQAAISKKFKKHLKDDHNIQLKDYILKYYFNNEVPKCACGCGGLLKFREKNALWKPLDSFRKYINCGHVGRNNEQLKNKLKETYLSKYNNIEWIKQHYYEEYGKENIENSAKDFLENNDITNIDIGKKYGIDIRTLKGIWVKLNLVTKEQWKERSEYRRFKLSNNRRKKILENKDIVCHELFDIIKNNPFKFNIRTLIDYYNENNLAQITTHIHLVLEELENIYGNEIYNYLEYSYHSKQEKEFLKIIKFFLKGRHTFKCGLPLQYGKTKKESYIYDICIDNKFIIEYDGLFYHNENNYQRDKEKENFAIDLGYKFIRVSSKDFKNIDIYKQIINYIQND